ncbi:MAG: asparagine synthetase B [Planctomycetes bacterium]|nr:asparagine synthetase B [Planctomycetota bacterium]
MCGILGVRRSSRLLFARFDAALESLRWRGRDALCRAEAGDWSLGVARLAITDRGHDQPIRCEASGRVAVLNGALTDAASQWPRFPQARTRNDAELLLLRFAADGAAGLLALTGPYAFALVDPIRDELWLGRDPCGEKPLWLVHDGTRVVAFASTVPALEALGLSITLPDAERARLLRFGFAQSAPRAVGGLELVDVPSGVFVDRARGALLEQTDRGGVTRTPQRFSHAFRDGVARCASAEQPVALALSGGIDSACVAAELVAQGHRPRAFQLRADGEDPAERAQASTVAARLGLELVPVDLDASVLARAPQLAAWSSLPLGDPSVLAVFALARAVAASGARVLLSGEGADEVLLGYPRHRALRVLLRVPRALRRFAPAGDGLSMTRGARFLRAARADDAHEALLEASPAAFRRAVLVPELHHADLPAPRAPGWHGVREREITQYLRGDLLPKLDVATLAAQIEGRCPFLDPAVLACDEVAGDPLAVFGKRPLRVRFAAELPRGHFAQKKRGFAVPLDRWWRSDDALPDLLLDKRTLERGALDPGGVRRMVDAQRKGTLMLGHALWLLVADELWHRAREAVR